MIKEALVKAKTDLAILFYLFILSTFFPAVGQTMPFSQVSQVYFFGDSLIDSGFSNNATSLFGIPNKAPTFTTFGGYIWSQYIAHDVKGFPLPVGPFPTTSDLITNNTTPLVLPSFGAVIPDLNGVDYGCGGSMTGSNPGYGISWAPSLIQQVSNYLAHAPKKLDSNAIYFIWAGSNDMLVSVIQNPLPSQAQILQTANIAATNIASQVAALSARGARKIVVMSLPNFGISPFATELATSTNIPTIPVTLKKMSYFFNVLLNQRLGQVITDFNTSPQITSVVAYSKQISQPSTGLQVVIIDAYKLVTDVIEASRAGRPYLIRGQSFFFTNTTDPACGKGVEALACMAPADGYFFADTVHPSGTAHQGIALIVEDAIDLL
ncbi:SGNH/GDSL hydrolase family protein [Legionella massiliensis]|nr:SGNH/GDSL hydrolase family protein [Legionella massiliensis]